VPSRRPSARARDRPSRLGPMADAVRLLKSTSTDPTASATGDRIARDTVVLLRPGPPERLPAAGPSRDLLLQSIEACVASVVGAAGCAWLGPLTVLTPTVAASAGDVAALVRLLWGGSAPARGTTLAAGTGLAAGVPLARGRRPCDPEDTAIPCRRGGHGNGAVRRGAGRPDLTGAKPQPGGRLPVSRGLPEGRHQAPWDRRRCPAPLTSLSLQASREALLLLPETRPPSAPEPPAGGEGRPHRTRRPPAGARSGRTVVGPVSADGLGRRGRPRSRCSRVPSRPSPARNGPTRRWPARLRRRVAAAEQLPALTPTIPEGRTHARARRT